MCSLPTLCVISLPICFTLFLSHGYLPPKLIETTIVPIIKNKGGNNFYASYQLFDYICENNLLAIEQFGFRRGHSTELAAIQLVDRLTKQMDLGNVPTNIYIDLSKAFDTLEHSILLDKLSYYGICGVENLMLRTYLSNRHQYVEYNDSKSETTSISIGVSQGSILGPLLFLIYINDLPRVSRVFSMLMYADASLTTRHCIVT